VQRLFQRVHQVEHARGPPSQREATNSCANVTRRIRDLAATFAPNGGSCCVYNSLRSGGTLTNPCSTKSPTRQTTLPSSRFNHCGGNIRLVLQDDLSRTKVVACIRGRWGLLSPGLGRTLRVPSLVRLSRNSSVFDGLPITPMARIGATLCRHERSVIELRRVYELHVCRGM